jgi:hypothetical protein
MFLLLCPLAVIPACFNPESRDLDLHFSLKTWIPDKDIRERRKNAAVAITQVTQATQ